MRQHPAFADTVIDSLMGLHEPAPAAPRQPPLRERLTTRRPGTPRPMPLLAPTPRVLVPQVAPATVPSAAPTSAGQIVAIGLMALVLMPAASLSMLMVLQAGLF